MFEAPVTGRLVDGHAYVFAAWWREPTFHMMRNGAGKHVWFGVWGLNVAAISADYNK